MSLPSVGEAGIVHPLPGIGGRGNDGMAGLGRATRRVGLGLGAILLAALVFLLWQAARIDAQGEVPSAPDPSMALGEKVDWLLDFGDIQSIDASTLPGILARMTPSTGKMPGVGLRYYQGGKLWMHVTIPALEPTHGRWVLVLNNYRVREARLVIVRDGVFTEYPWRYDSSDRRAGLGTRSPAFEFSREQLEGAEVLIGFNSLGAMRAQLSLETARAYDADEARQATIYAALLGIMWVLAVYLVVIGTRLGERSLVFAAGLSFTLGIFVYGVGGYVHFELLAPWPKVADVVLYATQPWPPAFWMLLAINYLHLPQRTPRLALLLTTIALLLPFQGILTLLTALGYPIPFITDNATPVMIGLICGLAPVIWFAVRGDNRARGLLFAFTPLGIGSFIRVAMYFTPAPAPWLTAVFDIYLDMVITVLLLAVIVVLDIQRREAALRQQAIANEQRFRAYAEIASDSYFETDNSGRIEGAAGRLTRELHLVEGNQLEAALAPHVDGDPETVLGQFRRAIYTGERVGDLEVAAKSVDGGGRRWLSFNLVPFERPEQGRGLRGTISDVTERVERREREGRQNTLSALGQLASGVAHEVNNLLHPIINLAQRVRDKHTSDEEAKSLLDLIVASGKHAGEIVAGVLNSFNPIRDPGERLPMDQALRKALETVKSTVPATVRVHENLELGIGPPLPPGEMLQVISNLLSNSIRAMDGTGRVDVTLARDGDDVVLTFADDGPGMPEHIRRRASEPFVTGRSEGTGLGLAVVANIVRNWHGELAIRSTPGLGTSIEIRIASPKEGKR
jgi:signal transduction histidine kinase